MAITLDLKFTPIVAYGDNSTVISQEAREVVLTVYDTTKASIVKLGTVLELKWLSSKTWQRLCLGSKASSVYNNIISPCLWLSNGTSTSDINPELRAYHTAGSTSKITASNDWTLKGSAGASIYVTFVGEYDAAGNVVLGTITSKTPDFVGTIITTDGSGPIFASGTYANWSVNNANEYKAVYGAWEFVENIDTPTFTLDRKSFLAGMMVANAIKRARVKTPFPPNSLFDEQYRAEWGEDPSGLDYFTMREDGALTMGYLYNEEDSGLMVCGGTVLPELLETEYQYAVIVRKKSTSAVEVSFFQHPIVKREYGFDGLRPDYDLYPDYYAHKFKLNDDGEWEEGANQPFYYSSDVHGAANYYNLESYELLWANHDIINKDDGTVYKAASDPTPYTGFEITAYDPLTTEFRAVGWRRVSKHTTGADAGTITKDDFTRQESGGWNYLKNIRSCTREKLYYKGMEVWPDCKLLITDDWSTISDISKSGKASSVYALGAEKDITLTTGEVITMRIIGFDHDDLSDGSGKAGITFEMKNLLATTYAMSGTNSNAGGWKSCLIRQRLQPGGGIYNALPADIKAVIRPVDKVTSVGNTGTALETTSDYAFLLSEMEIYGTTRSSLEGEGTQYDYYNRYASTDDSRVKKLSNGTGSASRWWARSPSARNTWYFCTPHASGSAGVQYASDTNVGVSFGFCV